MGRKKVNLLSQLAAKQFIHLIAGSAELLKAITVKPTTSDSGNIRILDMQQYGLTLTTRYNQVSFDYDQGFNIPFSCKELVYPIVLSDSDLEDMGLDPHSPENFTGTGGKAIAEMLARIYGKDFQDLILNGNEDLSEVVGESLTATQMRQNMLRQMDGYIMKLDDDDRVVKDSELSDVEDEVDALYELYMADQLITPATRLYMPMTDWLALYKEYDANKKTIVIQDKKLFYVNTECLPMPGLNHLLIGDPAAMQVRIKSEITLESQRSLEHRGYKYLMGTRADAIFVKELFRALEHTTGS
jgi:hypothetical protein